MSLLIEEKPENWNFSDKDIIFHNIYCSKIIFFAPINTIYHLVIIIKKDLVQFIEASLNMNTSVIPDAKYQELNISFNF